jgi:transposase
MSAIESAISQHASPNTVMHCLYGYFFLGMKRRQLAAVYGKTEQTISNWIAKYEETGCYSRKVAAVTGSFAEHEKTWIVSYYKALPLTFLDQAKSAFKRHFDKYISIATVWKVLHDAGLTWKVIKRRAIQINQQDICRFVNLMESTQHCLPGRSQVRDFNVAMLMLEL